MHASEYASGSVHLAQSISISPVKAMQHLGKSTSPSQCSWQSSWCMYTHYHNAGVINSEWHITNQKSDWLKRRGGGTEWAAFSQLVWIQFVRQWDTIWAIRAVSVGVLLWRLFLFAFFLDHTNGLHVFGLQYLQQILHTLLKCVFQLPREAVIA